MEKQKVFDETTEAKTDEVLTLFSDVVDIIEKLSDRVMLIEQCLTSYCEAVQTLTQYTAMEISERSSQKNGGKQ